MKVFMLAVLGLVLTQNVFALNLQGYRFSDSYRYSILDDSLQEKFEGDFVFTASVGHLHSPFYYSDSNLNNLGREIIKYNNVLTTGFSYYLNNNVSLGIDLNAINNSVFGETYNSLADTVLKSKINLKRTKTFSFSLNPQVYLPTGKTENFSSMDSVSGSLSGVAEKSFNRLHFLASLGALSSKNNEYVDVDHRQLLLTQLGISLDVSEKLNLNLESFRNFPLVNDKLQDEGKYFVTAKHKTHEKFSTYGGAGITGWDEVERNTYSFFVGLKLSEAVPPAIVSTVSVVSAAPVRKVPKIDEVYFENGMHQVRGQEIGTLDNVINFFNDPEANVNKIVIEGYSSSVGSTNFNYKLSLKRANSVKNYFLEKGLPSSALSIIGFGETAKQDPIEAKNRKVKFQISKKLVGNPI